MITNSQGGSPLQHKPKNSTIGVISFVLALVSLLGMTGSYVLGSITGSDLTTEKLNPQLVAAGFVALFFVTALLGSVLGLMGMFQRDRSIQLARLGLIGNGIVISIIVIALAVSVLLSPALPGTFSE
jgi:hypothetical protein